MPEIIEVNYSCINCEKDFVVSGQAKLYCSSRCQQDAKLVRYTRACLKDGRIRDPLVQQAIKTRLAFAYSEKGYYDEKARKLSIVLRKKVIEQDNGACQKCGNTGNEIDHIEGDGSNLDNLQLLCSNCHFEKTKSGMVEITPDDEGYDEIQERKREITSRIEADIPLHPCDDESNWNNIYQQKMTEQWQLLKQIKEDIRAVSENRDPFIEELVTQELDEIKELRSELESLETEEKARIDQVLTPELLAKVEEIKTEFSHKTENIKKSISEV